MKKWKNGYLLKSLLLILIINLFIFTGCNEQKKKSDSVGSGPTIEDMGNSNFDKDKDEVIKDAIKMSEGIMLRLNDITGVTTSTVFINHEAVLVALKLDDGVELSPKLREEIEQNVYKIYPEAKTIAVSDDDYVYESIDKLLRSYKENDPVGELLKDLQEILKKL